MKRPAVLLAVALLLFSFALISYRIIWLKYPILPAAPEKVWHLSIDVHVKGEEKETTVMIGVPYTHRDKWLLRNGYTPERSILISFARDSTRLVFGQELSHRGVKPLDIVRPSGFSLNVS